MCSCQHPLAIDESPSTEVAGLSRVFAHIMQADLPSPSASCSACTVHDAATIILRMSQHATLAQVWFLGRSPLNCPSQLRIRRWACAGQT